MTRTGTDRTRTGVSITLFILLLHPFPAVAQQTNKEVMYFAQGKNYPKGLTDFQAFGLFRKVNRNGNPSYTGWVMADRSDPNSSTSDMKTIRINGPSLSFTTTTAKGYVVKFDGRFLRRGDFSPFFSKDIPVVEGVVSKYRREKKIAEGKMRFTCGIGG